MLVIASSTLALATHLTFILFLLITLYSSLLLVLLIVGHLGDRIREFSKVISRVTDRLGGFFLLTGYNRLIIKGSNPSILYIVERVIGRM